jgi:hypothetical protein
MEDVLKIKYAEKAQVILCNPVRIEESDVGLRLRRQRILVEYHDKMPVLGIFRPHNLCPGFEVAHLDEWIVFLIVLERRIRFDERFCDEYAVQFIPQEEVQTSAKLLIPTDFVSSQKGHGFSVPLEFLGFAGSKKACTA